MSGMGYTLKDNGSDLTQASHFYLQDSSYSPCLYSTTSQIGIKQATDKLWRFVLTPPIITLTPPVSL